MFLSFKSVSLYLGSCFFHRRSLFIATCVFFSLFSSSGLFAETAVPSVVNDGVLHNFLMAASLWLKEYFNFYWSAYLPVIEIVFLLLFFRKSFWHKSIFVLGMGNFMLVYLYVFLATYYSTFTLYGHYSVFNLLFILSASLLFSGMPFVLSVVYFLRKGALSRGGRQPRSKGYGIAAVLLAIISFAIFLLVFTPYKPLKNKPDNVSYKAIEKNVDRGPFPGSQTIRKGNINGIPIAIPSNYFYFPFHYLDKSIWEAPKPGDIPYDQRTYDDGIAGFTLAVHWPDMQPRNWDNVASYRNFKENANHSWLRVSVNSDFISSQRPPESATNGLARRLNWQVQNLASKAVNGGPWMKTEKVRVHYEFRGVDEITGLEWAEPVGPYTDLFHTWNDLLYWKGDRQAVVSDFINCYNGAMPNPNSYHRCTHRFEFPEMKVSVMLVYPRSRVSQWREIKAEIKALLLGFKVDEKIN
ncbi:hypothetical protein [Marinomonas transparens]|uniref:Uncharacterized protein n=1 Tax=Marinomonas transparens TaxID=2795388 RepID=A0A934JX87_9GAMM|nr:hypothetical protein [Marinomonas transparens]MBJ7538894.1 hypothetical protein [Marinomonas transparens]